MRTYIISLDSLSFLVGDAPTSRDFDRRLRTEGSGRTTSSSSGLSDFDESLVLLLATEDISCTWLAVAKWSDVKEWSTVQNDGFPILLQADL